MTQEEKSLLLQDLCARLPYHPIVYIDENLPRLKLGVATRVWEYIGVDKPCKPYLRPMSSMTEEEKKEYKHIAPGIEVENGVRIPNVHQIEWLNRKMFAYCTIDGKDMFELGLALEAPEGMYKN